jgi:DNA (cytosine-5)-methyltransferase 1
MTPAARLLDQAARLLDTAPPAPVPGQLAVPDGIRIGSLCSGYGGLDTAAQHVFGGSLAWVADIDAGPRKILAHRWPDVPNLGDLTDVNWTAVEPVDVLLAGYPCQPFSIAGRRKGTADERHIWPHIAAAIRALRPRLCLFENVAGHVRLGLADVLADLAALGFDAEWTTVRASDVGAAHQRERLFILAWPADPCGPRLPRGRAGWTVADRRHDSADADRHAVRQQSDAEPRRYRPPVADRVGAQPDPDAAHDGRKRGGRHGDGGPDLRTAVAHLAADAERVPRPERRHAAPDEAPGWRAPTVDCGCDRASWGRYAPAIHRWETVTGQAAPAPVNDRGRLAPVFVEWLMGLPAGHVTDVPGLSRTAQLKALGNGVVPQQAAAALRFLLDRAQAAA